MDIRERCILVRKHAGLTQQAFARTIGVSPGVISNIELGRAPVTDVVCIAICAKFHINEDWLFNGTGDMMESDDLVEQLCERRGLNADQRRILQAAAALGPDAARLILDLATNLVSGQPIDQALPHLTADDLPPYENPIHEKKLG